jgi:hypothetical protein
VNNQEKELSIQNELRIKNNDPQQSKLFHVIGILECIYKLRHNNRVEEINDQIRDFVYDQDLEQYRDNEREDNGPSNYMIEQLTLSVLALMKQIDARVFGEGSEQWTLDSIEEICRSHDFGDIMDSWIKSMKNLRKDLNQKIKEKIGNLRQKIYAEDTKRTFNWLIKDTLPQCEIECERLKNFFEKRWKKRDPINQEAAK